jgi:hypothetical protein
MVNMKETPMPASAVQTFPLYHKPHLDLYAGCAQYKALMPVWYAAADLLKVQPPGTLADLGSQWLVMAPMGDQLYLFVSPDLSGTEAGTECYLYRPEDCEYADPDDFEEIRGLVASWLEKPVYSAPAAPEQVTAIVRFNYEHENTDQPALWAWNGNMPDEPV